MPRLTKRGIAALDKPGDYADERTLFLRVAPGGSRSWVQRLTINGRRRHLGLGGYPLVTPDEARSKALDNRRAALDGKDPRRRNSRKVPTFREAARRTHAAYRARWSSAKVAANWMQRLERHAMPLLGDIRVSDIDREAILRVLTPIWTSKPETGRRVRESIRQTLAWCEAHGFCERNVAGDAIKGALPTMPATKAHLRALPYKEVSDALDIVAASGSGFAAKAALRLVVLTGCRSKEVREAVWGEIDLAERLWIIPGERMKAKREHRVPLSPAAVDVLNDASTLNGGADDALVFPSPRSRTKPLSDMTLTKILRDNGLAERATVHGFRSSFRMWCADTGKPREVAEAALAHVVKGVEGAYQRSDILERRRRLMDQWAAYVTRTPADKVVAIRRA